MSDPVEIGAFVIPDLGAPIGRGGSATVWRAEHRGEPVAIKVLQGRRVRQPVFVASFAHEVRALAELDHPAILQVFDHGEIDVQTAGRALGAFSPGAPWLAIELASRGSLSLSDTQPGSWEELGPLVAVLLDALAHSHARGVLHRDIKPANILVRSASDLRSGPALADFGLAQVLGREVPSGTASAGTPDFSAPEQHGGDWRAFGPWTDLYALGATIWSLVNASPHRELRWSPRFDVPRVLRPWLARLLMADPADRFRCAAHAIEGLPALPRPLLWPAPCVPSAVGLPLADLRRPALTGRHDLQDALDACACRVRAEKQPKIILLDGEAGAGRTAVLLEFAEALVRSGSALEIRVEAAGDRTLSRTLQRALDSCYPWLDPILSDDIRQGLASEHGSEQTIALLGRVIEMLSRSALVLITIDDAGVQPEAARIVRAIASLLDVPALVVLTGALPAWFPRPDEVFAVDRLSEEAIARMLQSILPLVPSAALSIAQQCDGDLLWARRALIQIARVGVMTRVDGRWMLVQRDGGLSDGPVSPRGDLFDSAPGDLFAPDDASALLALGVLAELGPHVRDDVLEAAVSLPPSLASRLLDRGLISRRAEGWAHRWGFRRAVLSRVQAAGLTREVHERCARGLSGRGDEIERGRHLRLAGRTAEASADLAVLVKSLAAASRYDRVLAATDELLACGLPPPEQRFVLRLRLHALNHCGSSEVCEIEGEALLAAALAAEDPTTAADAARSVAVAHLRRDRVDRALTMARRAAALAEETPRMKISCLLLLVDILSSDDLVEAEQTALCASSLADQHGFADLLSETRQALASIARCRGARGEEHRWLRAALEDPRTLSPSNLASAHVALGDLARGAGQFEEARALYELACTTSPFIEGGETRAVAKLNLALLDLECGDALSCRRRLRDLADASTLTPALVPLLELTTAACAASLGDLDACEAHVLHLAHRYADHRILRQRDSLSLLDRCTSAALGAGRASLAQSARSLYDHLCAQMES